ncbi:hypothetical protein X798_01672 [Onchocerca flexuosa]|uniref:acid phosphatase n=1 Tax=Onchocerca flexuosa TaxID=387005 RepID=A0A238C294_9BILA|nr:hypothetical protein X798_01672 [Onchocerca flexuosa]
MSTVITVSAAPDHHENNDNNGILSRTINKSKVYPMEESSPSEIHNDYVNEQISPVKCGESQKGLTASKQQKSCFRRHLKEAAILICVFTVVIGAFVAIAIHYFSLHPPPELVYTNMIWRHGDRAPVHFFPNFTEKYMIAFPRGIGNLTKIGAEQAEYLGLLLKHRYFQSNNITSEQIYIRSTDVPRTIETARYVLKGMSFSNVTVSVETPKNVDTEIYELMQRELNYNDYSYRLFDTLNCLKAHDLALPEWLDDSELYEKLKFLSWHGVEALFGLEPFNDELQKKIRGGSSLRGIVSRIACKVNYLDWVSVDFCDEKFYGLSAVNFFFMIFFFWFLIFPDNFFLKLPFQHDMTIVALLSTFSDINAILGKVPLVGYGANIAFEIWRIDNSYKMKVLYANQWDENPREITQYAPGCGDSIGFCNVTKFIEQSRLLFFDDVQEQCSNGTKNLTSHVVRRSVGPEKTEEVVNLIELF